MRSRRILIGSACAISLAGCGGDAPVGPGGGDATPAAVQASHDAVSLAALGAQVTLSAQVRNAAGATLDTPVTWSQRRPGVAHLSAAGVVTAVATGTDTVIASVGALADSVIVTVAQTPASLTLAVTASETLTVLGTPLVYTATVRDANGNVMTSASVTWTSSQPDVVAVSGGTVLAAGVGAATITAQSGSASAARTVTVRLTGPVGPAIVGAPVTCTGGMAGPFPCDAVDLVSYLPIAGLGGGPGVIVNDVWGWTDPMTGTEWAIVGRRDGVAFVDLSDPARPRYRGFLPRTSGANASTWRDMKVYANHAFIVSDGAGQHGMQIFDLRQLRGVTAPMVFTAPVYTGVASVHNIAINEQTGFAFLVGSNQGGTTCGGGLHMVNIQNPANPTFAGCFADPVTGRAATGYTHDAQCVIYAGPDIPHRDREICFGANETHLSIADVTTKNAPVALSRATFPTYGYTHQGWLSQDQRYFFVNDELDELQGKAGTTRTLIWDVADLDDPILAAEYFGPTSATDHNNYVVGTRLFASNYQFGVRVLDVSNPLAPVQIGRFDTAPDEADTPGFGGSWSNYPFFASGIVVVTSGRQGLFVLRVR